MALNSRDTSFHFSKDFSVKTTRTTIKNPQINDILEIMIQVVGIMLKTKDIANAMFDTVDPWRKILVSIAYGLQ